MPGRKNAGYIPTSLPCGRKIWHTMEGGRPGKLARPSLVSDASFPQCLLIFSIKKLELVPGPLVSLLKEILLLGVGPTPVIPALRDGGRRTTSSRLV